MRNLGQGRVCQLQRAIHVNVPVEEEADFRRASAGVAAHGEQAWDAVDGVLDGLGDRDLHLLNRHHAVVDANDDARKVGIGKDRDGNLKRCVGSGQGENGEKEKYGFGRPR